MDEGLIKVEEELRSLVTKVNEANATVRAINGDIQQWIDRQRSTIKDLEDKVFNLENRTAAEILDMEYPEQELLEIAEAAIAELGYWRFLQVLQDVQVRLAKYYIIEQHA